MERRIPMRISALFAACVVILLANARLSARPIVLMELQAAPALLLESSSDSPPYTSGTFTDTAVSLKQNHSTTHPFGLVERTKHAVGLARAHPMSDSSRIFMSLAGLMIMMMRAGQVLRQNKTCRPAGLWRR
jgi:hypothetical protein